MMTLLIVTLLIMTLLRMTLLRMTLPIMLRIPWQTGINVPNMIYCLKQQETRWKTTS
jgi:hypothetical protein